MSSDPEALEARIAVLELDLATAQEALRAHIGVPARFSERVSEAWRVVRGVVNVASVRHYGYCEAVRADRELTAHAATLRRVQEENKATGAELTRLRRCAIGESLMKPTICRSVHYVAFGTPGGEYQEGAHRAAIITDVHHGTGKDGQPADVSLVIFNPTGLHFRANVPYDAAGTLPGTWHEPERE